MSAKEKVIRPSLRRGAIGLWLASWMLAWGAQAAVAAPVDSGTILQQVQPPVPVTPPSAAKPAIVIEGEGAATPVAGGAPFMVKQIAFDGNRAIATATLKELAQPYEGRSLTLNELAGLTARISEVYHAQGYPLARALVPAQTIKDGQVRIAVYEAVLGKVEFENGSDVRESVLVGLAYGLNAGDTITEAALEDNLLRIADVPGTSYRAVLKPGSDVGSSDLDIEVTRARQSEVSAGLDNDGSAATGRVRANAALTVFNPLRLGDTLSLTALSSGSDTNYVRAAYEAYVPYKGARAGAAFSALQYKLGGNFASIGGHGTADQSSLWIKNALVRSEARNVYWQLQFDGLSLRDDIDSTSSRNHRSIGVLDAKLSGDSRANAHSTWWSADLAAGHVHFNDAAAATVDASTAQSAGTFAKLQGSVGHLRAFGAADALYLGASAQWASKNLDSSQKFQLGGSTSVRAYDTAVLAGDVGYVATVEWRHELPPVAVGRLQAIAFVDTGSVKVNRQPWSGNSPNSATLSGAGVGLNAAMPGGWAANVAVATRIGAAPSVIGQAPSVRGWFHLSKAF